LFEVWEVFVLFLVQEAISKAKKCQVTLGVSKLLV